MNNVQCFKIKRGTKFDQEVKKHFNQTPKWDNVFGKVGEILGEKITRMALTTDNLYIDTKELTKEENKKLFTKDGKLKSNSKLAKEVLKNFKTIVKEEGLEDYQELRMLNFIYGVMRRNGQNLESYRTSENDIFYKADFDLEAQSNGLVEPITHIQYEEKYLEELKKKEEVTT
jgi:hypothetical protein